MRSLEWKGSMGNRISINLDRIEAVIEHPTQPNIQTVSLVVGGLQYEILASYDEVLKQIRIRGA